MKDENKYKSERSVLITNAVDDRLNSDEQVQFDSFIEEDPLFKKEFREHLLVKQLLRKHALVIELDEDFKKRIVQRAIQEVQFTKENKVTTSRVRIPIQNKIANRILSIAAILFLAWMGSIFFRGSQVETSFEHFAASHFKENIASLIQPTWSITDHKIAEKTILEEFDYSIHVPEISGATFIGFCKISDDLTNNFPLLEYRQEDSGEIIYLYAYHLQAKERPTHKRNRAAILKCQNPRDYYVTNSNDLEVVSWKWDEIWYSAVSNHQGDILASLVEPLNR